MTQRPYAIEIEQVDKRLAENPGPIVTVERTYRAVRNVCVARTDPAHAKRALSPESPRSHGSDGAIHRSEKNGCSLQPSNDRALRKQPNPRPRKMGRRIRWALRNHHRKLLEKFRGPAATRSSRSVAQHLDHIPVAICRLTLCRPGPMAALLQPESETMRVQRSSRSRLLMPPSVR